MNRLRIETLFGPHELSDKDIARFWSKVDKKGPDDCWLWNAPTKGPKNFPYARFAFWLPEHHVGGTLAASHLALMLAGRKVPKGMEARHVCPDGPNQLCLNPKHLDVGTHQENMDDKVKAGRQAFGERGGTTKLTGDCVRTIRRLYREGTSINGLARMYPVSRTQVMNIVRRESWKHVPDGELIDPNGDAELGS